MFPKINCCDGIYSSLDVRFTKNCDNSCSFCIEKRGLDSLGQTNIDKMVESVKNSGIKDILILGGEPFINPNKLLDFVSKIRPIVDKIYITTALPISFILKQEICNQIIDQIDGLNISIQSIDNNKNIEVLQASSSHDRIKLLQKLLARNSDKIRVSINLLRGGIDNKEKLDETINFLQKIGCKNLKINELQNSSQNYVSYEKIMGIKLNSPFSGGYQTKIQNQSMNIILKRSCFLTENSLNASWKDLFKTIFNLFRWQTNKFAVMYENGSITNNWETKYEN